MDSRQLRYFIEIVQQGSFTKAAEKLRITQPSLGYQVKRLETELQLQLLTRHPRGVTLTPAGQLLFDEGKEIVSSMERLQQRLLDTSATLRGEVTIGLTPSLGERLLVPLIERMKIDHPSLRLIITEDLSRNLVSMIQRKELDLALAYDIAPTPSLVLEKVESEPIGLATAASRSAAFGDVFDFSGLGGQPLVIQKTPHHMREVIEETAARKGVTLDIAFEMQSGPAVLRLVEHGLGGTITSLSAQSRLWREHRIVVRRFVNPSITAELFLVRSSRRSYTKAGRTVAAMLKALLLKHRGTPTDKPSADGRY